MAVYNVVVSSRVSFSTEVEADNETEAREKAMNAWRDCDLSEMEFWDTYVSDVCPD